MNAPDHPPGAAPFPGEAHPLAFTSNSRIPAWVYTDHAIYQRELERIFYRAHWCYVGLDAEIPAPGDFKRTRLGERSVIMVRDAQGEVNVVENRCAHRGVAFCREDFGNREKFVCPYHQWQYDRAGNLKGVPFRNGVKALVDGVVCTNSLSTRHLQPVGPDTFDYVWTHFGFADDTPEMTTRRLRQANLFGPGGFVSADDGEVIEMAQQSFAANAGFATLAELDGTDVHDTDQLRRDPHPPQRTLGHLQCGPLSRLDRRDRRGPALP